MSPDNVKSLLFVGNSTISCFQSVLFYCAKFWAQQGFRVVYISPNPVSSIPPSIGCSDDSPNPEIFRQIRFMYLPRWQDLLHQLYSFHYQMNLPSLIVIQELEHYCNADNEQLICASLLNAAAVCAHKTGQNVNLVAQFQSPDSTAPTFLVTDFFHDIWMLENVESELGPEDSQLTKLSHINESSPDTPAIFLFSQHPEKSFLEIQSVFKRVLVTEQ